MAKIIMHNLGIAFASTAGPALAQPHHKDPSEAMRSAEQQQRLAELARRGAQLMPFALAQTVNQWFEAQLRDHAKHAVPGHTEHIRHPKF